MIFWGKKNGLRLHQFSLLPLCSRRHWFLPLSDRFLTSAQFLFLRLLFNPSWRALLQSPFSSKYFLISLWVSLLTCGYFQASLFSFQLFGDFPEVSLLLISNLSPLWSQNVFPTTRILWMSWRHVLMARNMTCLGKRPTGTWRKCAV